VGEYEVIAEVEKTRFLRNFFQEGKKYKNDKRLSVIFLYFLPSLEKDPKIYFSSSAITSI
jgi:hypothetical protein